MTTTVDKIDSNSTGLRICEEESLGVLPAAASQVWRPAEPNSYSDFGAQIKKVARKPINASRQNQKGVTVDLDATAGYNSDMTDTNLTRLLRGFMFASIREQYDSASYDNEVSAVSAVQTSDDTFHLAYGDDLGKVQAGNLIFAQDFTSSGNNGVKTVASTARTKASGTLTNDGTNVTTLDTVTIGSKTYTFKAALTPAANEVKIGASDTATMTNLFHAINASGGVPGTDYAASTVAHPDVVATNPTGTTVVVTAKRYGYAGNLIASTEASTHLSWGAATLAGGTADIGTVENLTDETPAATARIQVVGFQANSGDMSIDVSTGSLPRLVSGGEDFTTMNLVAGQFVFIGGDAAADAFALSTSNGWARIKSIAVGYLEFDKTTGVMVADAGTSKTVQVFFGKVLKNETAESGLIKRRSFQFERDLGQKDTAIPGHQGEYLIGAIPNQLTVTVKQADKLMADLTFVGIDSVTRTQTDGLKSAAGGGVLAPALVSEDAFNTSDNVPRLRMSILDRSSVAAAAPTPLFAFLTEFTVIVNNNVKPSKSVAVLGAFEATAGQFDVSGKVTAYFSDVAAVAAVRNNSDVTFDVVFARNNSGFVLDVPLVSLGDGRLNVTQDEPVTLPLDMDAAADRVFNHTLLYGLFNYLPTAAE